MEQAVEARERRRTLVEVRFRAPDRVRHVRRRHRYFRWSGVGEQVGRGLDSGGGGGGRRGGGGGAVAAVDGSAAADADGDAPVLR